MSAQSATYKIASTDRLFNFEDLKRTPPDGRAWDDLSKYLRETYLPGRFKGDLDKAECEDVTNATIARIFPRIQKIDTEKYIKTTALRIAWKLILSRRKRKEVSLDTLGASSQNAYDLQKAYGEFAVEALIKFGDSANLAEIHEQIQRALNVLSEQQRGFVLRYWSFLQACPQGACTQKAFAEKIGWTETRVNVKLHRIREKLLANLKKKGGA